MGNFVRLDLDELLRVEWCADQERASIIRRGAKSAGYGEESPEGFRRGIVAEYVVHKHVDRHWRVGRGKPGAADMEYAGQEVDIKTPAKIMTNPHLIIPVDILKDHPTWLFMFVVDHGFKNRVTVGHGESNVSDTCLFEIVGEIPGSAVEEVGELKDPVGKGPAWWIEQHKLDQPFSFTQL